MGQIGKRWTTVEQTMVPGAVGVKKTNRNVWQRGQPESFCGLIRWEIPMSYDWNVRKEIKRREHPWNPPDDATRFYLYDSGPHQPVLEARARQTQKNPEREGWQFGNAWPYAYHRTWSAPLQTQYLDMDPEAD
jgi:hypothetical protein